MSDVELGSILKLTDDGDSAFFDVADEKVPTSFGLMTVSIVGDRKKPALMTFHDLGLNANSQFLGFFGFSDMAAIADKFCVYHLNAIGQEEEAEPLSPDVVNPSMDDLAQMVNSVVDFYKISTFVGMGVGAGANVLMRFALKSPERVEALILINANCTQAGWIEWGYQKANVYYLRNKGMTNLTVDYLMWHSFGRHLDTINPDLLGMYKQYFSRLSNPGNLANFIESYIWRTDLGLSREEEIYLTCPVLNMCGNDSPHVADTVDLNGKLNPAETSWFKVSDASGMVLEERPDCVAEAILLFLQGLGYFPTLSHTKWRQSRSEAAATASLGYGGSRAEGINQGHIETVTVDHTDGLSHRTAIA